jgi:hypothetical protein
LSKLHAWLNQPTYLVLLHQISVNPQLVFFPLWNLYYSQLKEFRGDKKRAEDLLKFGEVKRDMSVDLAKHAAWTTVASAILNLDEVLTKE